MFDSGATVFFAIFMAFWGKMHSVTMAGSISSDYPLFTFALKHAKSRLILPAVFIYVAVLGRNRTLFRCIIQPRSKCCSAKFLLRTGLICAAKTHEYLISLHSAYEPSLACAKNRVPGTHCLRMCLVSPRCGDSGLFSDSSVPCDVRVWT